MSIGDILPSFNMIPSNIHNQKTQILEHLNLDIFKVEQCPVKHLHNHKHCIYFHNETDRKRTSGNFCPQLCQFISKGFVCPYGENCQFSHNRVEQLFRPDKYKTKFCTFYPNNLEKCDYGAFCCFAHSEDDILLELIHNFTYDDDFFIFHYKTQWCPYNLAYHDKAKCVYAHNLQDFRRKPNIYSYHPTPCPNWNQKQYIYEYEDGCPQGANCKNTHGWKELEFHPLTYKTKPCSSVSKCQKATDCPNFHVFSERREVSVGLNYGILKLVPKNRIIEKTFKKAVYNDILQSVSVSTETPSLASRVNFKGFFYYSVDSVITSKNQIESCKQLVFRRSSKKRSLIENEKKEKEEGLEDQRRNSTFSSKKRNSLETSFNKMLHIKERERISSFEKSN